MRKNLKVLAIYNIAILFFLLYLFITESSISSQVIGFCVFGNLIIAATFLTFVTLKIEHNLIDKYKKLHPNETFIKYL